MTASYEYLREALEKRDLDRVLHAIPYARFLGLRAEADGDDLVLLMPGHDNVIGNPILPALHGGAVGALLESTAIFKLLWESQLERVPKTINITVDYLRSGRVEDTRARAVITKEGRRVANVQVHAYQRDENKPIAVAHAHFLVYPKT